MVVSQLISQVSCFFYQKQQNIIYNRQFSNCQSPKCDKFTVQIKNILKFKFEWHQHTIFQNEEQMTGKLPFKFTSIDKNLIIFKEMQNTTFPYDPQWETVKYETPAKRIIQFNDVTEYQQRPIHDEYLNFLADLQKSIRSKKISDTKPTDKFNIFTPYFDKLQQLLVQTPPIHQPMRYGNRAFKDWSEKANAITSSFLDQILPEKIKGAKEELYRYVAQSWGSNVRIDYGTGHEMSFMYFCWALYRLGFCSQLQLEQLVRLLFYKYINLMRKVQVQYMLEPAGSHGAWGLDDYLFLPFLLGAAQLIGHEELQIPESIHRSNLIEKYASEYMYINCIKFILEVKKGVSLAESSPVLNNISGAASWEKVTAGMVKMYKVEVLGKHPVIKHQYFGTIIPY